MIEIGSALVTMECGTAKFVTTYTVEQFKAGRILRETAYAASECIEYPYGCSGPRDEHMSRSGMTSAIRCQAHWNAHCDRLDRVSRDYPDSPMAPSWFDPAYAGETWDEDY